MSKQPQAIGPQDPASRIGAAGVDALHPGTPDNSNDPAQQAAFDLSNVVPFPRRPAETGARQAPAIVVAPDPRDVLRRRQNRPLWAAACIALSIAAHAVLFVAFLRQPEPLASIGIDAISVELVLGANTPAGLAANPGEAQPQPDALARAPQPPDPAPADPAASEPDKPVQPDTAAAVAPTPEEAKGSEPDIAAVDPNPEPSAPEPEVAKVEPEPEAKPPEPPVETPQPAEPPAVIAAQPPPAEPAPPIAAPQTGDLPTADKPDSPPIAPAAPPSAPAKKAVTPPAKPRPVERAKPPAKKQPATKPERKKVATPAPGGRRDAKDKRNAAQKAGERKGRTAARVAARSPNGVGVGRSSNDSNYPGRVRAHLMRFQRAQHGQGRAMVGFSLDGSGRVTSVRLVSSSGSGALDAEAQGMVRRASPFPAPPSGRGMSFTVPINFRVR